MEEREAEESAEEEEESGGGGEGWKEGLTSHKLIGTLVIYLHVLYAPRAPGAQAQLQL